MIRNIENLNEGGVPIGTWNKYTSKNPVQKLLINKFFRNIQSIVDQRKSEIYTSLDVGCGEGRITKLLIDIGIKNVRGCDFSDKILDIAKASTPDIIFFKKDIYNIGPKEKSDLIVACEVLEHLKYPEIAIKNLSRITGKYCLISIPEEPIFRILNFCAGKYWTQLGNSPGHVNHWSKKSFFNILEKHFNVITFVRSIPWMIILAKPK